MVDVSLQPGVGIQYIGKGKTIASIIPCLQTTDHELNKLGITLHFLTKLNMIESEISTDSFDNNLDNETLYERICALQDIIPAQSRHKISNAFSSLSSFAKSTVSFGGSALWIVSTSAFLLGVPWALALAEEQQYVQMEREQGMIKGANEVCVAQFISFQTILDCFFSLLFLFSLKSTIFWLKFFLFPQMLTPGATSALTAPDSAALEAKPAL